MSWHRGGIAKHLDGGGPSVEKSVSFNDDELEIEIPADVLYPYEAPYEEYWKSVFQEEHVAYDKFATKIQRFLKSNMLALILYCDKYADTLEELDEVHNMTKMDLDYIVEDKKERMMEMRLEWEKERMELEEEEGGEDFNREEEEVAQKQRDEMNQLIHSLREEISKEENIAVQLETDLQQEMDLEAKLSKLQEEHEEYVLQAEEAKAELDNFSRQMHQLEHDRTRVQIQNERYLDCVQKIAEALERYGTSWIELLREPTILGRSEEEEEKDEMLDDPSIHVTSIPEGKEISWVPPTEFQKYTPKKWEDSLSDLYFSQPDLFGGETEFKDFRPTPKFSRHSSQPDLFVPSKAQQRPSLERSPSSRRGLNAPRPSLKERHPSKMNLLERSRSYRGLGLGHKRASIHRVL